MLTNFYSYNSETSERRFSTNNEQTKNVLYVRNLCKSYNSEKPVLQNLCMTVRQSEIYGLLGSSACGKTTLLNCLLGVELKNSGTLLVFGKDPYGSKQRQIRRHIGYMPQVLALYSELTGFEVVQFYATIFDLHQDEVTEKWEFLKNLLEISFGDCVISQMSGGQKRRISLALSFIHSPALLLLDEPTVGLDPLLRQSVWGYLKEISSSRGTTIVITTHYVEETRQSSTIGILREGRLITEDSPPNLLMRYNCTLLEDVVMQLCKRDGSLQDNQIPLENNNENSEPDAGFSYSHVPDTSFSYQAAFKRIGAYARVISTTLLRFWPFLIIILCLPSFNSGLCLITIGAHIKDLSFGIVNYETSSCPQNSTTAVAATCEFSLASCKFISELQKDNFFTLNYYTTETDALESVEQGKSWGYLVIPQNYSEHMEQLSLARKFASNETFSGSTLSARLDNSQSLTAFFLIKHLFQSYLNFVTTLGVNCNISKAELDVPLHFREPVYGSNADGFTDFQTPGGITLCIFSLVGSLTSLIFINDFKGGTLSRARVSGLTVTNVVVGIYTVLGGIALIQIVVMTIVLLVYFQVVMIGSYWIYFLLNLLSGISSTSFGLCVGVFFRDELAALIISIFVYPVMVFMGGMLFPMEMVPKFWGHVGYFLPTTLPIEALRSVMERGMGLENQLVWQGVLTHVGWITFFTVATAFMFKRLKL